MTSLALQNWKLPLGGRLAQLLLLAVTVLTYSVLTIAIANSLFVSHVGASHLPYAFMLIGGCSLLAYTGFTQVVDRYSRPRLFQIALGISSVIVVGLWGLLHIDAQYPYYVLLLVGFFQWDFYNNILYSSLQTDYFTSLEFKDYAPYIGIAQAVGTLVGGGLTAILSEFLRTRQLLLCLPGLFAIAILQLWVLERTQRQLETPSGKSHDGIRATLAAVPTLVQRYPLIYFLAASSFLLVMIYTSSEYLWFSIYGQSFSEDELTGFLGLMRIVISIVQVAVLYGFTRPLLRWQGVARMNPVYPITTLLSFGYLALNLKLPGAIALQLNGDALYKAINLPVHQLNYNAIPRAFIGRVRTLSDGIIYACGLTLAGGLLWSCARYLTLSQTIWVLASLTLLLCGLRIPMGRFYAQGLEALIRADAIDLDDLSDSQVQLPPQSSQVIRELLSNPDRYAQRKGLELAKVAGQPLQFLPEIIALMPTADPPLQDRVLQLFSTLTTPETWSPFVALLDNEQPALQTMALEILLANQYPFTPEQLESLHTQGDPAVQALVSIARAQTRQEPPQLANMGTMPVATAAMQSIIRVLACGQRQEWVPFIADLLPQADTNVKHQCLEALAVLARPGDRQVADLAIAERTHCDPLVRSSAYQLLQVTRCPAVLPEVVAGLADPDPRVRQQAAQCLAAFGRPGLDLAQAQLHADQALVVDTAIAAIGQVRTKTASHLLFDYLKPDFQQLAQTRQWQRQLAITDPAWQPLQLAIANYHTQLINRVLYVLACLGHARTVSTVRRILATPDPKDRANAVEVLSSLSHRRFILPLLPLLEAQVTVTAPPETPRAVTGQWLRTKGYKLLLAALESSDRWIRAGALIALTQIPAALVQDPDPVVRSMAQQILPHPPGSTVSILMNRILLLKEVALFKNLSLDELLLIEQALEQETVQPDTLIFSEGSWATHLYIVATGTVKLVKTIDGEQRDLKHLEAGQYFGEIALFDNAHRWNGAIATAEAVLFKLEKNRFISLITQRPHIILELCRFLSRQLRETDNYLSPSVTAEMMEA